MIDPAARVHPSADVEPDVTIGRGTAVWHRAHLRSGARIGTDGVIGGGVFIDAGVLIGDRVKIQNGALIYHGTTVDDGVFIGPAAVITNDRRPRALRPDGGLATVADWTVSPVHLGHGCSIGAGAVVVAGCDVGAFAMVGAGAVVTRPVPAYALVAGTPARAIGWVCSCGGRLLTSDGDPAPAELDRYGLDRVVTCQTCDRRYRPAGGALEPAS